MWRTSGIYETCENMNHHEINGVNHGQILNYLKAYRLEIGLLINFGDNSLKFKRFIAGSRV